VPCEGSFFAVGGGVTTPPGDWAYRIAPALSMDAADTVDTVDAVDTVDTPTQWTRDG